MSARQDVSDLWDAEIRRWCLGIRQPSPLFAPWLQSYNGRGAGAVDLNAFPEPWIGPLTGRPRLVMLGLNPGAASHAFQGEEGVFTAEVAATSFSEWASSAPYTSEAWERVHGRNKYHQDRLSFARRFLDDDSVEPADLLLIELFPYHSNRVTAPMRPPRSVLDPMLFAPIAELEAEFVFAFGKPWLEAAAAMGLTVASPLKVEWATPSRQAVPCVLPSGQTLVILTQSGYAGPPGSADTAALRHSLIQ